MTKEQAVVEAGRATFDIHEILEHVDARFWEAGKEEAVKVLSEMARDKPRWNAFTVGYRLGVIRASGIIVEDDSD